MIVFRKYLARRVPLTLAAAVLLLALSCSAQNADVQSKTSEISANAIAEVVKRVGDLVALNYVFPDKGKDMQKFITGRLESGRYAEIDTARELARALTEDLRSVTRDRHLRVDYNPEAVRRMRARQGQSAEERKKEQLRAAEAERRSNYGFRTLEILEGNVGYLDLRGFSGSREAGDTAAAAMNFLANADAVIIDLRQNGGGSPYTIQFISTYFLKERTHLNSFQWRGQDEIQEFWTFDSVPGKRLYDTDLFILTSQRTFSAAEEFTYNLKNLKRATIVGETTGGGAHPGGARIVNDDFTVWIPRGRAINPITKTNWEGTGIEPHIKVPEEKALEKAHASALERLLAAADDEDEKFRLIWALDGLKAAGEPAEVAQSVLKKYVGRYGEAEVILEEGSLSIRIQGRKYRMIPVSETYFVPEGSDAARVEFVPAESGRGYDIKAHIRDGRTESYKRTDGVSVTA